ncbi:acetamidase/formamidase family protein [Cohnella thermotolerans]|uniref:acetamidase/formamidase family protein n=1 Tax=Cohnella thermotolerans TaxID=329858 RepID=UPI00047D1252|nr:acetamidase/formamidase family protein [Cohnella thermotolerans]
MSKLHRLDPSAETVVWGFIGGAQRPVLEVEPGDSVLLRSVSGTPDDAVPREWIPDALREIYATVTDHGPGVHILTGPVAVKGAAVGDTLAVGIERIRVDAPYGFNYMGPMSGLFYNEMEDAEVAIVTYDEERRYGRLGRASIPLRPFFGIMGVNPPEDWGRITSVTPGRYGGNMDNKELTEGATLYLPVMREGALFYAGDGHGAQGDGEIDVTAIETSLEGQFKLDLIRGTGQTWPYARKGSTLVSMGFDEDWACALQASANQMIGLLEAQYGLSRREAYRLCSICCDFRVTQAVNGIKGVHGLLDTSVITA